jgi:hypothetical protein
MWIHNFIEVGELVRLSLPLHNYSLRVHEFTGCNSKAGGISFSCSFTRPTSTAVSLTYFCDKHSSFSDIFLCACVVFSFIRFVCSYNLLPFAMKSQALQYRYRMRRKYDPTPLSIRPSFFCVLYFVQKISINHSLKYRSPCFRHLHAL